MEQISTLHAFKRHARPILAGVILGLTLIWAQNVLASPLQPSENLSESLDKEANTCAQAITRQERKNAIPTGLLQAISHAESGRWDAQNGAILAWPWTVTTGGKGYFLPNRVDAVAFVQALQADGVQNIDVGCMQINLKYHPDAFPSIEAAFDPEANATYAATFLRERFAVARSWLQAAGDYHSTTEDLNKAYRSKVAKLWHNGPTTGPNMHETQVATVLPLTKATKAPFRPDVALTQRFNSAFRDRRQGGVISGSGRVIANRLNALKPGAHHNRAQGEATDGFAQQRRAQLAAWRQDNGLVSPVTLPVVPTFTP